MATNRIIDIILKLVNNRLSKTAIELSWYNNKYSLSLRLKDTDRIIKLLDVLTEDEVYAIITTLYTVLINEEA